MVHRQNATALSSEPTTPSRRRSSAASSPEKPPGPLSITISPEERDVVKVNNYSVSELKNACDDALKRVCDGFSLYLTNMLTSRKIIVFI
jgi:signal peptidase complex subunit 2